MQRPPIIASLDGRIQAALNGEVCGGAAQDFASSPSARNKAEQVLATLKREAFDARDAVFVSIGGADGTELEHLLLQTSARHGVLLEFDDQLSEAARARAAAIRDSHGKEFLVFTGDVTQKLPIALEKIRRWRELGGVRSIVATMHAILHELPNRGARSNDLVGLLQKFLWQDMPVLAIAREPCVPADLPSPVFLSANCQPNNLAALASRIQAVHPELQTEPVLALSDRVRLGPLLALETVFKLFYLDSFAYELEERVTSLSRSQLVDAFRTVFLTENVHIDHLQSESFDRYWKDLGLKLYDEQHRELAKPQLHVRVVGKWMPPGMPSSRPDGLAGEGRDKPGTPGQPDTLEAGVVAVPWRTFAPELFVPSSTVQSEILENLEASSVAIIWGPRKSGKTWMLRMICHLLAQDHADLPIVRVSFNEPQSNGNSLEGLLRWLTGRLVEQVGVREAWSGDPWAQPGGIMLRWETLLRMFLLPPAPSYLLLAIDDADKLLGTNAAEDFFRLLRSFVEHGQRSLQDRLRLLLAVSSSPSAIGGYLDIDSSPFNVVDPTRLRDFDLDQLRRLAEIYRVQVSIGDLELIQEWVEGHPLLASLVLRKLRHARKPVADVLAFHGREIFEGFLHDLRGRLKSRSRLQAALRMVAAGGNDIALEEDLKAELQAAGLIDDGSPPRLRRPKIYSSLLS